MPITDAVNQQVLSFNVYLIAILYTDNFANKNAYTHTHALARVLCTLYADTHAHMLSITHLFFRQKILPRFCMRKT